RLLRRMRVLGARVDLQFLEHRVAQRTFREHPFYGNLQRPGRETRLHLGEGSRVHAAGVGAVPIIRLGLRLVSCDAKHRGVEHNYVVADIYVRGKLRLVLASQSASYFGGEPSEDLAVCVDQVPVTLYLVRLS